MPDEPPRLPDAPGDYGPGGRSPWMDVDWREHQRWVTVDGRQVNVDRAGLRTADRLHPRPVGLVAELARAGAGVRPRAPRHRLRPARLRRLGDARARRSRSPATGASSTALLDELGVGSRRGGGQLDGRLHRHRAGDPLPRARRAAGARQRRGPVDRVPAQRARARACSARSTTAWPPTAAGWPRARTRSRAARARGALIFGIVAHRPERLPGPLVAEQVRGSGKPGFIPALDALTDYPIRDRLGEIACPTLIVWGAEDKLVPARDADEFARLIPNVAQGRLAGDRPRGDARAPGGVQRAARGVPGRGAGRARRRVGRGRRARRRARLRERGRSAPAQAHA